MGFSQAYATIWPLALHQPLHVFQEVDDPDKLSLDTSLQGISPAVLALMTAHISVSLNSVDQHRQFENFSCVQNWRHVGVCAAFRTSTPAEQSCAKFLAGLSFSEQSAHSQHSSNNDLSIWPCCVPHCRHPRRHPWLPGSSCSRCAAATHRRSVEQTLKASDHQQGIVADRALCS